MSTFTFKCICCNSEIDVTLEQVGYVVYCSKCMAELIVPEFTGNTPQPISPSPESKTPPPSNLHQTDSVILQSNVPPDPSQYYDQPEPTQEPPQRRSSETVSQVIYQDSEGNPIIPDEVAQAVASGNINEMTETKLALAETLKALQEHQRALADARKELADKNAILSDTNMMHISDTTNKLLDEQQEATQELKLQDSSLVIQPRGDAPEDSSSIEETTVEEHFHEEHDDNHYEIDYQPFYTPHGDFLPFSDEDFSEALQHESDEVLSAISEIRPGPHCWSYSVFALLLETHMAMWMPEQLPISPMSGVFFGSSQKYLEEIRAQQTIFMNVMRRMIKPMGEQFQFALKNHDIYAFAEILAEVDTHMQELHQFMLNFQEIAMPKKTPFIRYREIMLQSYDYVRFRLMRIVERLDERSAMTPEQAMMGSVNVSLNTPALHEMALLLNLFPIQ